MALNAEELHELRLKVKDLIDTTIHFKSLPQDSSELDVARAKMNLSRAEYNWYIWLVDHTS